VGAKAADRTVVAAVLAGGASARMGGEAPKALAPLGGTTLLDHVLRRLSPQCDATWLSVSDPAPFDELGLRCIPDPAPRRRGPLAGLGAALAQLVAEGAGNWLLLAPCDAPFLPTDLAARLAGAAQAADRPAAVALDQGVPQPTFSLWRRDALAHVERLLAGPGRPGLRHAFDGLEPALVDWPATRPPAFFNVNTPDDLALAERWLDDASAEEG
jgi:molybdopterin-guanine dinucleotide biosynthesis protein A